MKRYQVLAVLIVSGIALYFELRSIKKFTLFFNWVGSVPFIALCFLTFIFLLLNIRHYINHKTAISFLPLFIGIVSVAIIVWHNQNRKYLDGSPTSFTATTYQIGSDGGFVLDFKRNGHLKAERRDHWSLTYYWGKYYKKNDTIWMDINLDFALSKQGIVNDTSLFLIGDTIRFQVFTR